MAASDPDMHSDRPTQDAGMCLSPQAVRERLEEEVSRAERHETQLSCLLVAIDNLDELAQQHGRQLREQTIDYMAATLRGELRRFDRVGRVARGTSASLPTEEQDGDDLLVILPGADGPRGEIVARRALARLGAIKVEAAGARRPLELSVGLAAWRRDTSAADLLAHVCAAVPRNANGNGASAFERPRSA